jgi:hypothetical protein
MASVIYLRRLVDLPGVSALNQDERTALCAITDTLDAHFTLNSAWPAVMLFRLLRAAAPSVRSARRPVSEVLFAGRPVIPSAGGGASSRVQANGVLQP